MTAERAGRGGQVHILASHTLVGVGHSFRGLNYNWLYHLRTSAVIHRGRGVINCRP